MALGAADGRTRSRWLDVYVEELLAKGGPPTSIFSPTFDHPLLKLIGLDGSLRLWKEYSPSSRTARSGDCRLGGFPTWRHFTSP